MRKKVFLKMATITLTLILALLEPISGIAVDSPKNIVDEDKVEEENAPVIDTSDLLLSAGHGDASRISNPRVSEDGETTWDCILFGSYWQGDTNLDGYCFSEETEIHKEGNRFYDQEGNQILRRDKIWDPQINNRSKGEGIKEGNYLADEKQRLLWRVLEIDEKGNALLFSEYTIEAAAFDDEEKIITNDDEAITWEKSTLRSYLNCLDANSNDSKTDYTSTGLINQMFNENERYYIQNTYVENNSNPFITTTKGNDGGNNTYDKLFCLSVEEATNPAYGFKSNTIIKDYGKTAEDETRTTSLTSYITTKEKDPRYGLDNYGKYWLRSPAGIEREYYSGKEYCQHSLVCGEGEIKNSGSFDYNALGVRPAFRMNLYESSSLWSYAGTRSCGGGYSYPYHPINTGVTYEYNATYNMYGGKLDGWPKLQLKKRDGSIVSNTAPLEYVINDDVWMPESLTTDENGWIPIVLLKTNDGVGGYHFGEYPEEIKYDINIIPDKEDPFYYYNLIIHLSVNPPTEVDCGHYSASCNGMGYGYLTLQMKRRDGSLTGSSDYTYSVETDGDVPIEKNASSQGSWVTLETEPVSPNGNIPVSRDFVFKIAPNIKDPTFVYKASLHLTANPVSYTDEYSGTATLKGTYGPEAGVGLSVKLQQEGIDAAAKAGVDVFAFGSTGFTYKDQYDGVAKTHTYTIQGNGKMGFGEEAQAKASANAKIKMPRQISKYWDISFLGDGVDNKVSEKVNLYAKHSEGVKYTGGETYSASDLKKGALGFGKILLNAETNTTADIVLGLIDEKIGASNLINDKMGFTNEYSMGAGLEAKAGAYLMKYSINGSTDHEIAGAEQEYLSSIDWKSDDASNMYGTVEVATKQEARLFSIGNVVTGEKCSALEWYGYKNPFDVKITGKLVSGDLKNLSISNTNKADKINISGTMNVTNTEKYSIGKKDIEKYKEYLMGNKTFAAFAKKEATELELLDPKNISETYNYMLSGTEVFEPDYAESIKNSFTAQLDGDVELIAGAKAEIKGVNSRELEVNNAHLKYSGTNESNGLANFIQEYGAVSIIDETNEQCCDPYIINKINQTADHVGAVLSAFVEPVSAVLNNVEDVVTNGLSKAIRIGLDIKAKRNGAWSNYDIVKTQVSTPVRSSQNPSGSNYVVSSYDSELDAVMGSDEKLTCTVGDPYTVMLFDKEENVLEEVNAGALLFSIGYTDNMLTELGLSIEDAEKLSMYRFDNKSQSYINVGGDVDIINKNVTIDLTLPGEYILGLDYEAPVVLYFNMSGEEDKPRIEAQVYDYCGISSLTMSISGKEFVTARNYKSFYKNNALTYQLSDKDKLQPGKYTLSISAVDTSGNAMPEPFTYDFMVGGSEQEIQFVSDIKLPPTASVKIGETITLSPEIIPAGATDKSVTWKTEDSSIATVDNGVVTGINKGSVDIVVTTLDGRCSATCEVSVTEEIETDVETSQNIEMIPGETRRLNLNTSGKYLYGVKWDVYYYNKKDKCISVKNGVVTAKKLKKGMTGFASVTARYGTSRSITYYITVRDSTPKTIDGDKKTRVTATKTVNATVGSAKVAAVNLPKALAGKTVSPNKLDYGIFALKETGNNGSKVTYTITPKEAGAAYIIWSVIDNNEVLSQAVTKVIIKKPIDDVIISMNNPISLEVGQGVRLPVITTLGNTDPKELSFKATGKGIKVSKSGYVVATVPGVQGKITVKAGNISKEIKISVNKRDSEYLIISKPSVNIPIPKSTSKKDKTVVLKYTTSKKSRPTVKWELIGVNKRGLSINPDTGEVTVKKNAPAGCYVITASAEGYNKAYCEVILK